jgi:predicted permease
MYRLSMPLKRTRQHDQHGCHAGIVFVFPSKPFCLPFIVPQDAGNQGNFPLVLVPAIARQSALFSGDTDGDLGTAYVLCALFAICLAAFSLGDYLLRLPHHISKTEDGHILEQDNEGIREDVEARGSNELDADKTADTTSSHMQGARSTTACCASCSEVLPPKQCHEHPSRKRTNDVNGLQSRSATDCKPSLPGDPDVEGHQGRGVPHQTYAMGDSPHVVESCRGGCGEQMCLHLGHARSNSGLSDHNSAGTGPDHRSTSGKEAFSSSVDVLAEARSSNVWRGAVLRVRRAMTTLMGYMHPGQIAEAVETEQIHCMPWVKVAARFINNAILNAPTISIFVGLFVALVPPIQQAFFPAEGLDSSAATHNRPPLDVLTQAFSRLAGAMIPSLMITLGASLSRGPGASVPVATVLSLVAIRLVLLPTIGTICVLGLKQWHVFHPPDRMFMLVVLLMQAMPSALNVYTLAAVHNNHADEVASILFWQYLASIVTIPVSVAVFLMIV